MEGQLSELATVSIQCDWEDFMNVPYKSIWVSRKQGNEQSVALHISGTTSECDNPSFKANLERNSLCVTHLPTGSLYHFIPAAKLFKNSQHKEIVSIDVSGGGLGVSCCRNGKLLIWDSKNGQVRKELVGHAGDVYKCLFFPSGEVVLSSSADTLIKIWSAITGDCPVTLRGHKRAVTGLSIVDRGRNIVSVSKDGTSVLWDVGQSRRIATVLSTDEQLNCCDIGELSDDEPRVKSADEREIGTSDKILLIGSEQGYVHGIQLSTRRTIFATNCSSAVNAVTYFSKELFLVGLENGKIMQCSTKDGAVLKIVHESDSAVLCMKRLRDKGVLVGRSCGMVSYLNPFSDTTDRVQLTGPDCDAVYDIAVTTDAVYTVCRDSKIRQYQLNDLLAAGV